MELVAIAGRAAKKWQWRRHRRLSLELEVTASFLSAPGVAPFTINSTFARTYLDVGANIDIFVQGNVVLSLQGVPPSSTSPPTSIAGWTVK